MEFTSTVITHTADNEIIRDYSYISEEGFLLTIALTSKADLITYYRAGSTERIQTVNARSFYPEWMDPVLVSITSDASVVCVIQSNGFVLMIPIRYLIDVNWGASTIICTEPTLITMFFPVDNSPSIVPTAAVCFTSQFSNTPYIIYGCKGGRLVIINLVTRRLMTTVSLECSIADLQLTNDKDCFSLLVTEYDGMQTVLVLETIKSDLRETIQHMQCSPIEKSDLRFSTIHNDPRVIGLDSSERKVLFYDVLHRHKENHQQVVLVPKQTYMVQYNPKSLFCVTESNDVYYDILFLPNLHKEPMFVHAARLKDRLLGFVPLVSTSREMEECFIITEKDFIVFKPKFSVNHVVLSYLINVYFSTESLKTIATNISSNEKEISKNILEIVLKKWSQNNEENESNLNGALSLAMESEVDMNDIVRILSDWNAADVIVPYLMAMCEKNGKFFKNLLEIYEIKLKKLKKQDTEAKEALEKDLRLCFMHSTASTGTFKLLLKHEMWTSICILLTKEPHVFSQMMAEHLMELPTLHDVPADVLSRMLNLISWTAVEALASPLLTKIITCLANIDNGPQLALLANFGQDLIAKVPSPALALYAIATIRFLYHAKSKMLPLDIPKVVLSLGSNCAVAITTEDIPVFWGEFSAGVVRLQTDSRIKGKNNKTDQAGIRQIKRKKTTFFPEKIKFLNAEEEPSIVAADCGTEHVLLLSSTGTVYSYGRNRFGQCGTGDKNEIQSPVAIFNNYGKAKKIIAGHYHSGLINVEDEVYLWGWSVHGQLALDMDTVKDYHNCRLIPSKVTVFKNDVRIVDIALGYAHSLFLTESGDLYGCGAVTFGQLALDPQKSKNKVKYLENTKCRGIYKIPLPEPMRMISSNYFHTVAVSESQTIYEWGISPMSLKFRMGITRKFNINIRDKIKKEQNKESSDVSEKEQNRVETKKNPESPNVTSPRLLMQKLKPDVARDFMNISMIEKWPEEKSPIKQISAGYSHNALVTEDGQLFTWGKGSDMQLGHGNKVGKDKPSKVMEPILTKWKHVVAGRGTTMAISSCGRTYVWGRNDKYQLGLGYTKKHEWKLSFRVQEMVDLPDDNSVQKPTPIPGLQTAICQAISYVDREYNLSLNLMSADQQTLVLISRNLAKHVVPVAAACRVHIAAGDILNAVDVLCALKKSKTGKDSTVASNSSSTKNLALTSPQRSVNSQLAARSPRGTVNEGTRNTPPPTFPWNMDDKNGNSTEGLPLSPVSTNSKLEDELIDELLDKLYNLLRIHPYKDIQALVLLKLLQYKFPIYNRLAQDNRLCRLVDPFLELPLAASPNSSVHSAESAGHRRLADMQAKERFMALKSAKMPPANKVKALKQRCEQLSPLDQLRFYTDCGHYEKCVVESGSAKAEFAALRNKLRKCSRCAAKGRPI